jgi:hypothetical protein
MSKSWIQHPITLELVPRDEYVRPKEYRHAIHGLIEPFISPIDKTMISDRKHLAEHNKKHNVTNSADFSPEYLASRREGWREKAAETADRKRTMYEAWSNIERM